MSKVICSLIFLFCFSSCFLNYDAFKLRSKHSYIPYAIHLRYDVDDKYWITATGFAVDKDRILTADHFCQAVKAAASLPENVMNVYGIIGQTIKNNGRDEIDGFMIDKQDSDLDLCILYRLYHNVPVLKIDTKPLKIGDPVSTVGAPLGFFPVETHGHIVAKSESVRVQGLEDTFITSIPVCNGNSGGFVLRNGKVVGLIVRAINKYINISLAVKAEKIKDFISR